MKQGPMDVNGPFTVNENRCKRQFPLVQPHFTARSGTVFTTKLVLFRINKITFTRIRQPLEIAVLFLQTVIHVFKDGIKYKVV